jgi:hypothetical protein
MSYVCVPLYETLGENAVEFILQHADVQLVFVEGCRMARMVKALRKTHQVQAVVYWSPASPADIKVRELGPCYGFVLPAQCAEKLSFCAVLAPITCAWATYMASQSKQLCMVYTARDGIFVNWCSSALCWSCRLCSPQATRCSAGRRP